jgi:hypothetical protein
MKWGYAPVAGELGLGTEIDTADLEKRMIYISRVAWVQARMRSPCNSRFSDGSATTSVRHGALSSLDHLFSISRSLKSLPENPKPRNIFKSKDVNV